MQPTVDLGFGVTIYQKYLDESNALKDFNKEINCLLSCLFSTQELSTCTLSGRAGKKSAEQENTTTKSKLDPNRISALQSKFRLNEILFKYNASCMQVNHSKFHYRISDHILKRYSGKTAKNFKEVVINIRASDENPQL